MIYFIQARPSGYIKIGFTSKDVGGRLDTLQTGNHERLVLLAAVPGDLTAEKYLHRRFARFRARPDGEWFRGEPELLREIARAVADRNAIGPADTVARKLARRSECRYGLKGLRVLNVRNGHEFVCLGTEWDRDGLLRLFHWCPPETTREEYATNAARSLGADSDEFRSVMAGYDGKFRIVCLGYLNATAQRPKSYAAEDCMLLEDWPVACCDESTDKTVRISAH